MRGESRRRQGAVCRGAVLGAQVGRGVAWYLTESAAQERGWEYVGLGGSGWRATRGGLDSSGGVGHGGGWTRCMRGDSIFNIQYSARVGGRGVMRQDIGVGWMDAVQRFPRVDFHVYKCRVYIFL